MAKIKIIMILSIIALILFSGCENRVEYVEDDMINAVSECINYCETDFEQKGTFSKDGCRDGCMNFLRIVRNPKYNLVDGSLVKK